MKRHDVIFSPAARADLSSILRWLLESGVELDRAERYITRIIEACHRLAEWPRSGRSRDDLKPGLRTITVERRVLIAYLIKGDHLVIANVLHAGRDLDALYREPAIE